jgi:SWI/SNF-related matrix-associated actin-dependent regulator of chromatin subfamily A member 5
MEMIIKNRSSYGRSSIGSSLLNFICPEIFVDYKDLDSFLHKYSTSTKAEDEKNKIVEALHKILRSFLLHQIKSNPQRHLPSVSL